MKNKIIYAMCACAMTFQSAVAQEFINIQGEIIPLSKVISIRQSAQEEPSSLSLMMKADESISLFYQALEETGWVESLKCYIDKNYSVYPDSIDWTNDYLVIPMATEYDNVAYMERRRLAHTVFAEPNTVYKNKGINSIEDLKSFAKQIYDPMYPEDAHITDVKNLRNSLNRFVAYHILPFKAGYYQLTEVDGVGSTLAINWNRRKWDIADWYETCMPYSTMKLSFPSGSQSGLYVNRRGVQARADERGGFVRGAKVTPPNEMTADNNAINGIYHYVDQIIAYGQETQQVVFNDRMRIDCSSLSPDFITSGARGHRTRSANENGKYGTWDATSNHNNKQTCLGFKPGSAKNIDFDGRTHLHVRPRTLSFWSYGGDEVAVKGMFDVSVKLPPVPAGKYELRLGTCVDFQNRGIVACYIDNEPVEMIDFRPGGVMQFGWKQDSALGDEEVIAMSDRIIRKKGWMKGPKSYYSATSESGGQQGTCFRDTPTTLRRIIGTFYSNGESDHYVRFQQLIPSMDMTMAMDYIEIVPVTVYDNEYFVEDRW